MRLRCHPLLLAGALLLVPGSILAQSSVRAGQTVSGRLDSSDQKLDDDSHYETWRYSGRAGEQIRVTLRSGEFDAFLAVGRMAGGSFEALDSDDDGAGGTDAQLTLTLPENGEYLIRANSLSAGQLGGYTMEVESGSFDVEEGSGGSTRGVALHPSPGRVRAGQTVSGQLDTGDPKTFDGTAFDDWIYTGRAGERLAVVMRSTSFDSYLQFGSAENGEFAYIGADDDGAGGNDSLFEVTLPADGEYVIRANTLFSGFGSYSIEVRRR